MTQRINIQSEGDVAIAARSRIRWTILQLLAFEAPDTVAAESLKNIRDHVLAQVDVRLSGVKSAAEYQECMLWAVAETRRLIDAASEPT